jgi:hypothetical protein
MPFRAHINPPSAGDDELVLFLIKKYQIHIITCGTIRLEGPTSGLTSTTA